MTASLVAIFLIVVGRMYVVVDVWNVAVMSVFARSAEVELFEYRGIVRDKAGIQLSEFLRCLFQ